MNIWLGQAVEQVIFIGMARGDLTQKVTFKQDLKALRQQATRISGARAIQADTACSKILKQEVAWHFKEQHRGRHACSRETKRDSSRFSN